MSAGTCSNLKQLANPDISGIGVRISFYIQNLLLVVLVDRSWQDAPSAIWTFVATNVGMTISAIIQAKYHQLSFFQALQLTNLVWLANFGIFLSLASYSRHRRHQEKKRVAAQEQNHGHSESNENPSHGRLRPPRTWSGTKMKLAVMCQTLATMSLTIFTWARPDVFAVIDPETGEECRPPIPKYVAFFGVELPGDTSGRVVGLAFSSFLMASYLFVMLSDWYLYIAVHRDKARRQDEHPSRPRQAAPLVQEDIETQADSADDGGDKCKPSASGSSVGLSAISMPQVTITPAPPSLSSSSIHEEVPRRATSSLSESTSSQLRCSSSCPCPCHPNHFRSPSPADALGPVSRPPRRGNERKIDPMFLGITILQCIISLYFIINTELLLHVNPEVDDSDSQWTFGQILALTLVVPSLLQVIQAFREHGIHQIHHKLTTPSREAGHHRGGSDTSNLTASVPRPPTHRERATLLTPDGARAQYFMAR